MTDTKAIEDEVVELISNDLLAMNYELIRVKLTGGGRYMTLQVMAERVDRKSMTVNDCVEISRTISPKLDALDPVKGRYTLEVSSPGLERPLVRLQDFERFTGHVAYIELASPIEGKNGRQRRFEGSIVRVTGKAPDAEIELKTEAGDVRVPANAIARAKLVPNEMRRNGKTETRH